MKRMLIQTQLSNYDTKGKFILECDSGWQMVMGRVRVMLKLCPDLDITVMGPDMDEGHEQCITHPVDVNPDLWEKYGADGENRLHYIGHRIIPNALVTRYDFDWTGLAVGLNLGMQKINQAPRWDIVYINDPMHLRNFRAMFFVVAGYTPKFVVHSHFIDNPTCPKFPKEASLWLGQCEAAIRADVNFWQCESAMEVFFQEMKDFFSQSVVDYTRAKSSPWDDGYSSEEINVPVDMSNLRFDPNVFQQWREQGKRVIFVPNRIGGRGRSSDYTNCGKFMFDILPQLRKRRDDFVVLAGNPSQKFFNHELEAECGPNGYVSLVPDAFNRDEFKYVARNSAIAVGLYDQDSYGGTVARECIDLGCLPLWIDNYEYARLAQGYPFLAKPDFSDIVDKASFQLEVLRSGDARGAARWLQLLRDTVKRRCSYEETTPEAMRRMGLL
jgi:hypothetical protein